MINAETARLAQLRRSICGRIESLGEDELRVLDLIAERLVMGATQYGALHIESDKRDWRKELVAELVDGTVYGAIELLKGDGSR